MSRCAVFAALLLASAAVGCPSAWAEPYNPYAGVDEPPAPLAADGTIQWGVFYKSAKLQQSYERLWSLGACRGSNKAITVPVAENKLVIDRLAEADFEGVVRAASGNIAGGMVAFATDGASGDGDVIVAQLHPAGVSRLSVRGPVSADAIAVGAVVRLTATIDEKGRTTEPVRELQIVTPPADFVPDGVLPGRRQPLVGTVVSLRRGAVVIRVEAGAIRRVTLAIAPDATVTVDAARLDLVSAGDHVGVRGRLWTGAGTQGGGTVFASDVVVTKPAAGSAPGPRTVGAR
ncbi:MAG: hypothetical protein ACKON8_08780 [Planctomycetota bacterium]